MEQTSTTRYTLITSSEGDSRSDLDTFATRRKTQVYQRASTVLFALVLLCLTGVVSWRYAASQGGGTSSACATPVTRREWRALTETEQLHYLDAVQCLRTQPSVIGMNHSLYDDFPYIHSKIGNYSHGTMDFLLWHRHFLHIYEIMLKEKCMYTGHATYWDWALDWEDLTQAPIWDSTHGFGGNGNTSAAKSVAYGHCVTSGPFAHLSALYYAGAAQKHCLSRGFLTDLEETRPIRNLISPQAVQQVLDEADFEGFYTRLEFKGHNAIPALVRGDFFEVTAPYDPVFFLHHGQLDRLWWMWQAADPDNRVRKLLGRKGAGGREDEELSRVLDFGDLAPGIAVEQILNTEAEVLCYVY
ncbi:Di-copper centre-containing protein [Polyplosphaeria fusca]|uniref:Di-copper centre-containing protein n=1 Tax=Polyplosphaeria fusca TaxID=682080 RepID=A0A9P4QMU1_9PLEO|nr:Di-copper centre-containing protein [Polyplosphaeria fusca]